MLVLDSSRTKQDFLNRKGKSSSRTNELIQMEMKHFEKFCLFRLNSLIRFYGQNMPILCKNYNATFYNLFKEVSLMFLRF